MTVSAAVRFSPSPPALRLIRNNGTSPRWNRRIGVSRSRVSPVSSTYPYYMGTLAPILRSTSVPQLAAERRAGQVVGMRMRYAPGKPRGRNVAFIARAARLAIVQISGKTALMLDRRKAAQAYIESVGGKLHGFWYGFGTHDGYNLWEAPDNVSMAAVALAISSGGALSSFETTVLLTVDETIEALRKVEQVRYRAPGT